MYDIIGYELAHLPDFIRKKVEEDEELVSMFLEGAISVVLLDRTTGVYVAVAFWHDGSICNRVPIGKLE